MKKILSLTIAAFIILAMVGVGTWAYFSDTEQSTGNVFTAGTLNLKLSDGNESDLDGVTASFGGTTLKPGDTVGPSTVTLKNIGNVTANHAEIKFGVAYTNTVLDSELPGSDATDASWLEVTALSYGSTDLLAKTGATFDNADIEAADNAGNNDGILTMNELNNVILRALAAPAANNGTKVLSITVVVPTATDNGPQGDTVTVTVTFGLYQASGNILT